MCVPPRGGERGAVKIHREIGKDGAETENERQPLQYGFAAAHKQIEQQHSHSENHPKRKSHCQH